MKSQEILPENERVGLDQKVIEALGEAESTVNSLKAQISSMDDEMIIVKQHLQEAISSAHHWKSKSQLDDGFYLVKTGEKYPVMKIGELPEPFNYARMALDVDKLSNFLLSCNETNTKELSKSILMFLSKQS